MWKKEDELKQLKSELAALDRKIQLELAPPTPEMCIRDSTLSDDEIKDLLTDGHTKLLKGFKSKQGKNFDAIVAFDGEYNTTFVFPEKKCKSSYPKKRK